MSDHLELARLRAGDEAAFGALVSRHHAALRRLARTFVASDAAADEVVQDTWLGVLAGLPTFEGRASLKTWIFRILVNRARTRGVRDKRSVPASALLRGNDEAGGDPVVDPSRFDATGHWAEPPTGWDAETPERQLLRREAVDVLEQGIRELPEQQRLVVVLRDALDWSSDDVCNVLGLTETNQRVLLHRARARLRTHLETYGKRR